MREQIARLIVAYAQEWSCQHGASYLWRDPIVRLADADSLLFLELRSLVDQHHHMPSDFLPNANTVISIFLPFTKQLASENIEGMEAAQSWADAYNQTNAMASELCEHLAQWLFSQGCEAAAITDAGMISTENPRSRWSQRHVAFIAGQGTWGVNNMLISDAGCVGRYYSLVARMPLEAIGSFDKPQTQQRCLFKRTGSCLLCVKRCVNGALMADGFDRFKCLEQCLENERTHGADVCGKCIVGLPCSHIE